MLRDKTKMDCRTREEILNETVNSIAELNDMTGIDFPWRTGVYDNEIILKTKAIQSIIKYINELKEGTK